MIWSRSNSSIAIYSALIILDCENFSQYYYFQHLRNYFIFLLEYFIIKFWSSIKIPYGRNFMLISNKIFYQFVFCDLLPSVSFFYIVLDFYRIFFIFEILFFFICVLIFIIYSINYDLLLLLLRLVTYGFKLYYGFKLFYSWHTLLSCINKIKIENKNIKL